MGTISRRVVPAPVLDLRHRFESWRRARPKLCRIPVELLREAAHLAQEHGTHLVARALRIEYNALKRHVAAAKMSIQTRPPAQRFIEVSMPAPPMVPEYLVEMERADGGRMRVRLVDQGGVVALAESFWRCRP